MLLSATKLGVSNESSQRNCKNFLNLSEMEVASDKGKDKDYDVPAASVTSKVIGDSQVFFSVPRYTVNLDLPPTERWGKLSLFDLYLKFFSVLLCLSFLIIKFIVSQGQT